MSLPIIGVPKYETVLPSTGQKILFRPFLVKEEKILLLAMEAGDKKAQNRALKQIIKNCVDGDLKVDSLPVFDIEHLFVQIRGKSVGEVLEPIVVCPSCSASGKLRINLSDIDVGKIQETPFKIMINDNLGLTVVYPNMEVVESISSTLQDSNTETIFAILGKCIEMIFDNEKTYNPKEYSQKEMSDFIESLPSDSFKKMIDFVSEMPRVQKNVNFRCPKCGLEKQILLKGIEDFFGSVSPTIA